MQDDVQKQQEVVKEALKLIKNWGITFGNNLAIGTERKCQACGVWFRLGEKGGDYHLQNIGRKDQNF